MTIKISRNREIWSYSSGFALKKPGSNMARCSKKDAKNEMLREKNAVSDGDVNKYFSIIIQQKLLINPKKDLALDFRIFSQLQFVLGRITGIDYQA